MDPVSEMMRIQLIEEIDQYARDNEAWVSVVVPNTISLNRFCETMKAFSIYKEHTDCHFRGYGGWHGISFYLRYKADVTRFEKVYLVDIPEDELLQWQSANGMFCEIRRIDT